MKDQLQNRLFQYAEEPPAKVWKDIEYALDEGSAVLSRRLENFEAAPPPSAWQHIEASLQPSPQTNTRQVPVRKIFRYAAAAVVLFVVVSGVRYLVNMPEKEKISVVQKQEAAPAPSAAAPDTEEITEAPAIVSKQPVKKLTRSAPNESAIQPRKINGNRYVTVENDEGQQVRLSKKVVPVFDCAEAKVRASKRCQDNIRELQEKIGSAFTSPSADFAGLMDMIKSLEKQQ